MKDLNIRPEAIKLVEVNSGSKLFDIHLSNILLYVFPQSKSQTQLSECSAAPQARGTKGKNKQMGYIKLKSFCTAKDTINKMEKPLTE